MKNEQKIRKFLRKELDNLKATCLLATVKTPNHSKDYIIKDKQFPHKINKNNTIGVGSCTKTITAISILKLCEQKNIKLNDKITNYLPEQPNNIKETNPTIEELLSHSSGLAADNQAIARLEENANLNQHKNSFDSYKSLKKHISESTKQTKQNRFTYYNTGFVLLGKLIENITDKSFENYVTETILKPNNIKPSSFGSDKKSIKPYIKQNTKAKEYKYPSNPLFFSEGGLFLSLKSAKSFLGSFQYEWKKTLNKSSYNQLVKPRTNSTLGPQLKQNKYCLGLNKKEYMNSNWFTHCGISYVASSGFCTNKKYGAFIMINGPCDYYPSNIPLGIISHLKNKTEKKLPYYSLRNRIHKIIGEYTDEKEIVKVKVEDRQPYVHINSYNPLVSNKILKPLTTSKNDYRFKELSGGGLERENTIVFKNPETEETELWMDRFCLKKQ